MKKKEKSLTMTHHLLLAQFSHRLLIPIEEIAENYLGMAVATARRKANAYALPFPTIRIGDNQRSPMMVHIDDLVRYIDKQKKEAEMLWMEFQVA
ncbi:pyocin activator PrtN family protein [Vibrio hibernica]|uniref:pyocin activator PrtN family protein n=1 Tax=Vibrio hibernica TaxID=2587465 RepID=UPI001E4BD3D7|nr:pyocin activator PrtN family protein [Vibrio hibernica]